jgi:hypothetical protein
VKGLGVIMRVYSYIFHFLLSACLLALSVVTLISGVHSLKLDMLPWKDAQLTYSVLILGVAGLLAVGLAVKGVLRLVFFLWTVAVMVLMVRGYFFGPYFFGDTGEFFSTLALVLGAVLACAGAWFAWREQPARR